MAGYIPSVEERFREVRQNLALLDRIFSLESAAADQELGRNPDAVEDFNEALRRVCEQTVASVRAVEKALDVVQGYRLDAPDVEAA